MPVRKIDPKKEAEKEARTYWKILETTLELHPYLNIFVFQRNNKTLIRFAEKNTEETFFLIGEGENISFNQAVIENNRKLFNNNDSIIRLPSYKLAKSSGNELIGLRHLPVLIRSKKYRIYIIAEKDSFDKKILKTIIIESNIQNKENSFLRIQMSSGKKYISDLILEATATKGFFF